MNKTLILLVGLMLLASTAQTWTGAPTAFNQADSLDLADYCDGTDELNDTTCIGTWIKAAKTAGKDLYISSGTYMYTGGLLIFNGFHLQCSNPSIARFRAIGNAGALFVFLPNWGATGEPWSDFSFENCGFDLNGSTVNFASVIAIGGGAQPLKGLTIRGNVIYDSQHIGDMDVAYSRQRQYIVATNVEDVIIEGNMLSGGGRIKTGGPGKRVVVRNNSLFNVNDNAITVVAGGSSLSEMILIENNVIVNPIGSGIFFGADGQAAGTAAMTVRDVTVRRNAVYGTFKTSCITGTLPNNAERIEISNNSCTKLDPSVAGSYTAGVSLGRNNTSPQNVVDVTVKDNTIVGDYGNLAGIFTGGRFDNICVVDNSVVSMWFGSYVVGQLWNNGAATIRTGTSTQLFTAGDIADCYNSPF